MAVYCIDDGGDGSQTDTTQTAGTLDWSKADTTIANLIATYATALTTSGNVIYFGSSTTQTQASALTITGPASGLPVLFISADPTNSTPTYQVASADQIITTGSNSITFAGLFALYGIRAKAGSHIIFTPGTGLTITTEDCALLPGSGSFLYTTSVGGRVVHKNLTINCTQDSGSSAAALMFGDGGGQFTSIDGLTLANVTNRIGSVFQPGTWGQTIKIAGADMTGLTSGSAKLFRPEYACKGEYTNIRTAASYTMLNAAPTQCSTLIATNIGPADAPEFIGAYDMLGTCVATASVYRTGGAEIEGIPCAWLITTYNTNTAEGNPFCTPWMYGLVSSTGSKTFDVFITNDTGDFDDSQVWLEVEKLGTADEADWTLATDHRVITASAGTTGRDDTTSSWTGGAAGFDTYKQRLRVTATINETGQYRARVVVGLANIASTRDFYVDPKVTVA